jgi:diguanylate cyclase (GGDEF)-like protein/PAS domain S-box-containing protein
VSETDRRPPDEAPREDPGALATALFDANPQPVWVVDAETLRFLAVNESAVRHYGYARTAFLQLSLHDVCDPEELPGLLRQLRKTAHEPPGAPMQSIGPRRHRRSDGVVIDVELSWSRIVFARRQAIVAVLNDVTERRLAEDALWRSEDHLRAVIESAPIVLWATDKKGVITLSEGKGLNSLGLRAGEMVGRSIFDAYRDEQDVLDCHRRALSGETVSRALDVGTQSFEAQYSPLRSEGEIVGVFGVATDVTASRQAEAALREARQFTREVVANAGEGVIVLDRLLRYRGWSRAMEDLTGLKADDVIGREALELFPHLREQGVDALLRRALHGETVASEEVPYRVPATGRTGWVTGRYSPHRDMNGDVQGVIGLIREVTDRKRIEKALHASEARHRTLAESVSDALVSVDEKGRITFGNAALERLFGYGLPFLLGQELTLLMPERLHAAFRAGLQRYVEGGERPRPWEGIDLCGLHRDGHEFPVEVSFGEFQTDEGRQFPGVIRDLTERRRATEALRESELKFRTITNTLPCAVYIYQEGRFPFANHALTVITGYTREELEGLDLFALIHPDSHEVLRARQEARLADRPVPSRYDLRITRKDGALRWLDCSDEIIEFQGHRAALGTAFDVTERRQAEVLERDRSRVVEMVATNQALSDVLGELVAMVERQRPEMIASLLLLRGGRLFQGAASRMPGEVSLAIMSGVPLGPAAGSCGTAAFRREMVVCADIASDPIWADYRKLALDNGLRAAWSVPIFSGGQEVLGTFALYYREPRAPSAEDVALLDVASRLAAVAIEQRDLTDRLAHQAHHDALTGLPNRALFEDRLGMAVAHAHRQARQLAVLFLDLDQFKIINDSLGHGLGDKLLQAVAERLQGAVREGDTVARQGGDEFILLLPWIAGAVDAAKVAQKVLETIRQPFRLEGHDLFVTTSIGVSLYPDDGDSVAALIKNSDSALYRAKERGRDGVQLYAPAMNAQAAERLGLESSLRRALPLGQFELHYQPVVSGAKARVSGVEALLRWRHPERGLLAPADFISLAEITGLIAQLGLWALRTACAQVKAWHDQGHPGLTLSVNVSPRQFLDGDLVAQVAAVLHETGLEPALLELEITETVAMQHAEATVNTLRRLRELGVRVAIDDFGTGYSSLAYLRRFPLDTVKIDRTFVHEIHRDPVAAAISRAVIVMAHTLHLRVVAEGVESEAQRDFLLASGCESMQGFLFGAAVPPAECVLWLPRAEPPLAVPPALGTPRPRTAT